VGTAINIRGRLRPASSFLAGTAKQSESLPVGKALRHHPLSTRASISLAEQANQDQSGAKVLVDVKHKCWLQWVYLVVMTFEIEKVAVMGSVGYVSISMILPFASLVPMRVNENRACVPALHAPLNILNTILWYSPCQPVFLLLC